MEFYDGNENRENPESKAAKQLAVRIGHLLATTERFLGYKAGEDDQESLDAGNGLTLSLIWKDATHHYPAVDLSKTRNYAKGSEGYEAFKHELNPYRIDTPTMSTDYLHYQITTNTNDGRRDHPYYRPRFGNILTIDGRHTDMDTLSTVLDFFDNASSDVGALFSTVYYFNPDGTYEKVSVIPNDPEFRRNPLMGKFFSFDPDSTSSYGQVSVPMMPGDFKIAGAAVDEIEERLKSIGLS